MNTFPNPAWPAAVDDDCVAQWLAAQEKSKPALAPTMPVRDPGRSSEPDAVEEFIDHLDPPQPARADTTAQLTVEEWLGEPTCEAATNTPLETTVDRALTNAVDLYQAFKRLEEVLGGIEKRCADLAARPGSR
jgi:hypothetical protein